MELTDKVNDREMKSQIIGRFVFIILMVVIFVSFGGKMGVTTAASVEIKKTITADRSIFPAQKPDSGWVVNVAPVNIIVAPCSTGQSLDNNGQCRSAQ